MSHRARSAADSALVAFGPVAPGGPPSAVAEAGAPAHFTVDERGRIAGWDSAAEALYGFGAYEVIGRVPTMFVSPELDLERDERVREVLAGRPVPPYETERMRKDGTRMDVEVELAALRDAAGAIVGASATVRAISPCDLADQLDPSEETGRASSRRERSQRRLAEAQERFRIAFVHAPNGIALLSTAPGSEGCFLDANPAVGRQLGYDGEDLIGRCLLDFLHPEARVGETETLAALLQATEADTRAERRFVRGDGRDVWLQIGASVVRDRRGRPLYAVAHLQDVTDARRHEAELRHLADHDGLTGLVNRRCFGARLEAALAEAHRDDRPAAVLVVDLDNFKGVNDTYGHAVGDELLRRVAGALRSRVRATDVVARLGGDEFGILLPHVTAPRARAIARELLAAVEQEAAVPIGPGSVRVTASIGVSTLDASTRATGEALLSDADTAMYEAKGSGRNRFATTTGDDDAARVGEPPGSRRNDQRAPEGELQLWQQPMLNLTSGDHDRIELLVRLREARGDAIPAGRFLPLLKRFGRARDVDRWVVAAAIELVGRRQVAGVCGDVEINLDAASITDEDFVAALRSTLAAAPVDPRAITFGITAAASISDVAAAHRLMSSLTALGCRFALDHFGASAGSLRDLKHLPFEVVKIDGELIADLATSRFDQLAVRSVVDIARGRGLTTVAERVGDDATLDRLRDLGVDYAQGFHVAVPRPATVPGDLVLAA